MKIAVLFAQYPPEELNRRKAAVEIATPAGIDVEIVQMGNTVYKQGLTELHRSMAAQQVAEASLKAQSLGCGAVVPYGTLDLGVEEARHVVDIPVIGSGHSGVRIASMLAQRFSIICYDKPHAVMFSRLIHRWNVDQNTSSIHSVDIPITSMASDVDELRRRFVEIGRNAVEDGTELIVPLGMTMVPVLLPAAELSADVGVPVLDPLAISMSIAGALMQTGYHNSRVAYPVAFLDR